jgi:hypothetical protein
MVVDKLALKKVAVWSTILLERINYIVCAVKTGCVCIFLLFVIAELPWVSECGNMYI